MKTSPRSIRLTFTLLLLLTAWDGAVALFAQNGTPPVAGTRGRALGGTGLAFTDHYAAWSNPAGLGKLAAIGGNLAGEQRFGLAELQLVGLGVGLPLAGGGLGFTVSSFGNADYRESRAGLSYGRALSPNFRIGGEIVGYNTSVIQYESRFAATFSIGAQLDILPELTVGFRGVSLLRVETVEGEYLPQLLAVGLGYRPNDKLLLLAEVQQDVDYPARFHGGLEYLLTEKVDLRLGVVSGPAELSFGLGFSATEQLRIEVVGAYHESLGLTPGVGLVYLRK